MVGQKKSMIFLFTLFVLSIFFSNNSASAQTDYQFTSITGDEIKISSVAQQKQDRIELSKKLLADLQAGKILNKQKNKNLLKNNERFHNKNFRFNLIE